jgi:hypothetical protein
LSLSIIADPTLSAEAENLALEIAGKDANPEILEPARRIAEAQIDLLRIRQARHDLIARYLNDPEFRPNEFVRRVYAIMKIVLGYLRAFDQKPSSRQS